MYWIIVALMAGAALLGFGAASAGMPFSEFAQSVLCGLVVGTLVGRYL